MEEEEVEEELSIERDRRGGKGGTANSRASGIAPPFYASPRWCRVGKSSHAQLQR